jgi:hypothetical protein
MLQIPLGLLMMIDSQSLRFVGTRLKPAHLVGKNSGGVV